MVNISFPDHAQFGKGAELVAFYRGNRKAIIERAQKQAVVEVYNELDEDTWYKALRGETTWKEAVRVLGTIYDDAWSFPESHLPPEPTDDLRAWMKDWADAAWWHEALDPESEIVAVGTLKNWFVKQPLSLKKVERLRERVWSWYVRAMIAAQTHRQMEDEIRFLKYRRDALNDRFYPNIQARIKPLIDAAQPEDVIKAEHRKLYELAQSNQGLVDWKNARHSIEWGPERLRHLRSIEEEWEDTYANDRTLKNLPKVAPDVEPFEPEEYVQEGTMLWPVADGDNPRRYVYFRGVRVRVRRTWVDGKAFEEELEIVEVKQLTPDDNGPHVRRVRKPGRIDCAEGSTEVEVRYKEEWVPSAFTSYDQRWAQVEVWEHRLRVKGKPTPGAVFLN